MAYSRAHIVRQPGAATPQAPALSFEGSTLTFAQLDGLSSQSANALRAEGVQAGDRVALLTKNRPEFYELLFACSKIGAILVGLNWRLAQAEISAIAADASPSVVIVGPDEQVLLSDALRSDPGLRRIVTLGDEYDAWRAKAPAVDPCHIGLPDDVSLVLYTSGTTGLPKGVMLTGPMPQDSPSRGVYDMPWLVSITPFGRPVVPEVYKTRLTSSGSPT